MEPPTKTNPQKPRKKSTLQNVAVLTGIGFEMGIIIFLAAKAGLWLDAHYGNEKKIYTAVCTILGVAIALWIVLRQTKRLNP